MRGLMRHYRRRSVADRWIRKDDNTEYALYAGDALLPGTDTQSDDGFVACATPDTL